MPTPTPARIKSPWLGSLCPMHRKMQPLRQAGIPCECAHAYLRRPWSNACVKALRAQFAEPFSRLFFGRRKGKEHSPFMLPFRRKRIGNRRSVSIAGRAKESSARKGPPLAALSLMQQKRRQAASAFYHRSLRFTSLRSCPHSAYGAARGSCARKVRPGTPHRSS